MVGDPDAGGALCKALPNVLRLHHAFDKDRKTGGFTQEGDVGEAQIMFLVGEIAMAA
jgi:hypothetical protein